MAKGKKIKRIKADSILARKTEVKDKKLNPFEVHLNKEKFFILGRKCKHDRGLPGVSRAKAIKKRKNTIGQEFQQLHKVNKFKDRRLGGEIPVNDDLATARFATEKMTQIKKRKRDIFNLNDDEVLTHKGHTLQEIEQFEDPASDDSDEELDAQFTEAAHFGGDDGEADRKAAIEEKIAEAKRKKIEAIKEKNEVFQLTSKLDANYKNLIPVMGAFVKGDEPKPGRDEYDRILKELVFEPRGEVTDKLRSEEELARKEKERLEKLEEERLSRMRGEESKDDKPKHKSADDLDDGYFAGSGDEEEEPMVAYDLNENEEKDGGENSIPHERINCVNGIAENEEEEQSGEEEEEESDDSEEDEDNLSDLKEAESESEDDNVKPSEKLTKSKKGEGGEKRIKDSDLKAQANKELPYTYEVPSTYEELHELLSSKPPDYQHVIVERMVKCNHPKLDPSNRDKMVKLFGFLLQYINDIFSDLNEKNIENSFAVFDRLSPHLYDLSHMNPEKTSNCFLEVIKEKYEDYKKSQRVFPTMDFIIFFKLISNLFSTSDFRHLVVTPAVIFMSHVLSRAHVRNRCDISIGLFMVTVILEYTQLSKRFLPAMLNFIRGVIFLSVPKRPIEVIKIVPPFTSLGAQNSLLVVTEKVQESQDEERMFSKDFVIRTIDTDFKIRALNTALKLLTDCIEILKDNIGACYLTEPFEEILEKLDLTPYPTFVKQSYSSLEKVLESVKNVSLKRLVAKEKKPKALKLMEPRIEKVYDDKRRPKMSKEKEMRAIMLHKVKRETKGAIREIRRDTAFITKLQIKKQIQSDLERKEKVARIFAEASVQQGELNALARKKKR